MWASRVEHERLLTGTGTFVADIDLSGQAWMTVVRSPVAHGRIRELRTAAARAQPGVLGVFTAADVGAVPTIPIRIVAFPGMEQRLQPVIGVERVRYVGEPVAVVVADDPYAAEDAAELVEIDIDELAPVVDADQPGATGLWDEPLDNVLCEFDAAHGDVDAVFAHADVVVAAEFRVQRHTGLPLEPRGLLARWQDDGTLHLWGVTKYVHFTRRTVAGFFAVDPDRVVCHHVDVGGMFGTRGEVYPEDFLVPWAARRCGRPVKWVEDRREHLVSINHSRQHRHRFELALDRSGRLLGFRDDAAIDLGAYPRPIGARLAQLTLESLPGPYRWEAFRASCRGVATTKTPAGTMRGPSTFESTFVRERALDIAARRLGIDPLELRMRNLLAAGDLPHRIDLGPRMEELVYDTGDYPAVVRDTLAAVRAPALRADVARRREAGERVGIGLAFFVDHSGVGKREVVGLQLAEDGTFRVATSGSEVGQGLASMVQQVAGAQLGLPPETVEVVTNDSRAQPDGMGTYASRSTVFVGSATHDASVRLLALARERAAARLDVPAAALVHVEDGFAAGENHLHWKELAPIEAVGEHHMEHPTFGFGMHLAVVRVDEQTGGVTIERLEVAYDCGRALDRASVAGQLRGATVHGLGGALLEELRYDETGQPLSTTFMDYLLPTAMDVPDVGVHVFETAPVTRNPLGVKGVGEAGIMGVAPAVANAIADALGLDGARLTVLPLRPDVVVEEMAARAEGAP